MSIKTVVIAHGPRAKRLAKQIEAAAIENGQVGNVRVPEHLEIWSGARLQSANL